MYKKNSRAAGEPRNARFMHTKITEKEVLGRQKIQNIV